MKNRQASIKTFLCMVLTQAFFLLVMFRLYAAGAIRILTSLLILSLHTGNHYRSRRKMIKGNQKARGASKRYGLYQAKASGDSSEYETIEEAWFKHWNIERTGKASPMAQFDESHAKWLENGREC